VARAGSELLPILVADDVWPKTEIAFPNEPEPNVLFFVTPQWLMDHGKVIMQGSMQQLDYSTKTIFHERSDLVLFILSVNASWM